MIEKFVYLQVEMAAKERKPEYIKAPKRKNTRRASWHDYCAPAIYMITISKNSGAPEFGSISEFGPVVLLSEAGNAISDAIFDIGRRNPSVSLLRHVVMPDHIHFVIHVKERLSRPLGVIIQKFKANVLHMNCADGLTIRMLNPFARIFMIGFIGGKGSLRL